MCKVSWCDNEDRFYKNGNPKTYCSLHNNRPGNAPSRPWLFYKTERIAIGKLECEKCGDNLQKRFPHRKLKDVIKGMDVDHILKPTEWDIKNNPWYNVKTKKIEHPMSLLNKIKSEFKVDKKETTIQSYLKKCSSDPSMYASSPERILNAIGKAEIVDTKDDPQLSRIHQNKKLRIYPAFSDFYGMEADN
jgi:hypothetical protein